MLLDKDAESVLDFGDVLRICGPPAWNLVIFEPLVALIIAWRPKTL